MHRRSRKLYHLSVPFALPEINCWDRGFELICTTATAAGRQQTIPHRAPEITCNKDQHKLWSKKRWYRESFWLVSPVPSVAF